MARTGFEDLSGIFRELFSSDPKNEKWELCLRLQNYICLLSQLLQRSRIRRKVWLWTCKASADFSCIFKCLTHLADILRYANVGVRKSAGMVAHSGTRLGALGEPSDIDNTSPTSFNDGMILICVVVIDYCIRAQG